MLQLSSKRRRKESAKSWKMRRGRSKKCLRRNAVERKSRSLQSLRSRKRIGRSLRVRKGWNRRIAKTNRRNRLLSLKMKKKLTLQILICNQFCKILTKRKARNQAQK